MAIPALPGVSGSDKVPSDRANGVIEGILSGEGPGKAFSIYGPMNLVLYAERTIALTTAAGSLAATVSSATGLAAGQAIKSDNVPPGTTIGAITGTDITLALMPQYWSGTLRPDVDGIVMGALPVDLATLVGATIVNSHFAAGTTVTAADATTRILTTSNAPSDIPATRENILFEFQPDGSAITATGEDAAATVTGAGILFDATVQLERSFDGGATFLLCNIGGSGALAQWIGDGSSTGTPVSLAFGDPEAAMLYRLNCVAHDAIAAVNLKYRISATGQAGTSLSLQVI